MPYVAWEEFWWNHITGAHAVVDHVALALMENKMVLLKVPSDLPWRHAMRSAIQAEFSARANLRDIVVEEIDAVDDNATELEPGRLILQRYADSATKAGYREKARISIQQYISNKKVIKNRIIWVKGLDTEQAEKWITFCRGFSPRSASDGLFVLEVRGRVIPKPSKRLQCIDFDDRVSSYDVQQFNSVILDRENVFSTNWKRYLSTVVATVCGVDAELSELLLRTTDFRTETALDGLRYIDAEGCFDRRGTEMDSDHPLWHLRHGNTVELLHRIWTAQIQVLYPMIELERQRIVGIWYSEIEMALKTQVVTQFGTKITEPTEVELGTLCYMMKHKVTNKDYLLYIPDEEDRERVSFLHECRNKLAHMTCCLPGEVAALLEGPSYDLSDFGTR